ncbi:MAG: O-antigen ligase family protein [Deltaproteobacteria bacterium]|nr:O-antigen ligase family protein [Deltaproteobacteria bacterium]
MITLLGWMLLALTAVGSLMNPRLAVYCLVWYDNLRPNDDPMMDILFWTSIPFSKIYTAVLLFYLLFQYRRFRMTSDTFHWTIALFFFAVVNSALFAPCFGPAIGRVDDYFKLLLQYYFICAFLREEKHLRSLLWANGSVAMSIALYYCYTKFIKGGRPWEGATGDRNEMAMYMVMVMPMFMIMGLTSTKRFVKLVCFGSLGPLALTILFCGSRGGLLGMGAVMGYMLYRMHHKRWLVVMGVFIALVGLANVPPEIAARFTSIGTASKKDASAIGRINAWGCAKGILRDRPLSGMGVGNFLVDFRRYAPDPEDVHVAHSSFFQLMGDMGYPGLILWIYMVLSLWLVASWLEMRVVRLERGRWTDTRYYLAVVKGGWVGYVLCGSFLSQEDMDLFYHLLAITSRLGFFIGAREVQVRIERREAANAARQAALQAQNPSPEAWPQAQPGMPGAWPQGYQGY